MRDDTLVYFAAPEDLSMVKIGCSYLPSRRVASFQGWCPIKLVLLASAPGTLNDERALHGRHMATHAHHEWFHCSPKLLADIAEIKRLGYLPDYLRGSENEPSRIKTDHSYRLDADWRERNSEAQKKRWAISRARAPAQTGAG